MNFKTTNNILEALDEIRKAQIEMSDLLGKDASPEIAMALHAIKMNVDSFQKQIDEMITEQEAATPEKLIEQMKQKPFQFSEKETRQYVRRYGKANMRRLATECESKGIFGHSWAAVEKLDPYPIGLDWFPGIGARLELLSRHLGFKLAGGEQ